MVQALLQAGANPRAEDNQGVTPLMYACMGGCSDGHVQSLQYILDAAGPRAAVHMDHAGRNAADYAAQFLNAPQFHILTTMRPARTRSDLWLVTNMLGYGGLAVDALRAITRTSGR